MENIFLLCFCTCCFSYVSAGGLRQRRFSVLRFCIPPLLQTAGFSFPFFFCILFLHSLPSGKNVPDADSGYSGRNGAVLCCGYFPQMGILALHIGMGISSRNFWQMRKEKIDTYAKNAGHWWTGLTVSGILFAVTYVLAHTFRLPEACYMTVRAVSAVCFVIFLMWLCMKIPVRCRVTAFLGKYSLYIYTMQGMILYGLTNCTDIRKPWMYCLIAVPGTLILAVIVQNLQNKAKTLRISGRNMYKKR